MRTADKVRVITESGEEFKAEVKSIRKDFKNGIITRMEIDCMSKNVEEFPSIPKQGWLVELDDGELALVELEEDGNIFYYGRSGMYLLHNQLDFPEVLSDECDGCTIDKIYGLVDGNHHLGLFSTSNRELIWERYPE